MAVRAYPVLLGCTAGEVLPGGWLWTVMSPWELSPLLWASTVMGFWCGNAPCTLGIFFVASEECEASLLMNDCDC